MSYSFNVRGASKAEALALVSSELDKVVEVQPIHEADRAKALTVVESFMELIEDIDGHAVSVSVSGYLSAVDGALRNASVNVNVGLIAPQN